MESVKLRINQSIEQHIGAIVHQAEEFLNQFHPQNMDLTKLAKPTQIRNLVNIAKEAPHAAIITNFIRYQIGRDKKPIDRRFGEGLIRQLDSLSELARSISQQAGDEHRIDAIHIELVSRFLGYMNRHFVYLTASANRS